MFASRLHKLDFELSLLSNMHLPQENATPAENFFFKNICYLTILLLIFNISMVKNLIFILILVIITPCLGLANAPCPLPNYAGNVYSAKVLTALDGGIIPISQAQDIQCYNYSLPFSFGKVPDIAIAIHDFQTQSSNGLNFFIKPLHTDSVAFVPFAIRTQWAYTQWVQIQFSFIAEDRADLEANYYLIDTGILTSCQNGKKIQSFIPFRNRYQNGVQIRHNVFLHGFEVTSTKNQDGSKSPFQFQIYSSSATSSGLQLTLTVTTTTQVNNAYISYVAFQLTPLSIVGGGFVYDVTENPLGLYYSPQTSIPRNFARIYGITGFLINNSNQKISYETRWDGFTFTFNFKNNQNLKYFSFSFIFFTGSICSDCQGFEIQNNGECVAVCPAGTFKTDTNTCISCGEGRQWDGKACVVSCPQGQFLNPKTNLCQCPPTLNWDGKNCITCSSGKIWSSQSKSCQCSSPLKWNGFTCARLQPCSAGKVWDVFTFSCQCPEVTYWDGAQCRSFPQCQQGQVLNSNYICVCQQNFVLSGDGCIFSPCLGGQIWSGSKCVCPLGQNFNGSMCIQCINGQKWNAKNLTCSCEAGYKWSGQLCQKSYDCSNGRIWNIMYQQCICPDGSYWSGYSCIPVQKCFGGQYFDTTISKCVCLSGFQWDGKVCVQCNNGKVWNVTTVTCSCPPGTTDERFGCRFLQKCSGGKQWNQNSWTCECPIKTVWNGNFCIANPCPFGQRWNQTLKSCQCPDNKMYINQVCVPLQISCTNGRIWNQNIYACACPPNTFPTISSCDPLPVCNLGKVYNPLNNQCQCPFGLADQSGICTDPKCPTGQFWNGAQCQIINCPPPSYFLKDRCVYGGENSCDFGYVWNGDSCKFYPTSCPSGSIWNNSLCQNTKCGNGYYSGPNGDCISLPQRCPPSNQWDGSKCSQGNSCPKGTFLQGNNCMPMQPCKNGFVWDPVYIRCICPPGTINSANRCVECGNDQKWIPGIGCACPDGSFDSGASCQFANPNKCQIISNAIWNDNKCRCRPGFTKVGFQCICYGTQVGDFCDKCSYKPNSKLNERTNTCECTERFTQIRGLCIEKNKQIKNQDPNKCNVGTYFDQNHKACLACPPGCLSCSDCYTCRICQPQFVYDPQSQKCLQICGDGKKFVLECDDGNNVDGDGCSRDCKIQLGYNCVGGSPEWKDNCLYSAPNRVQMQILGQVRKTSSIVLNIKLNYLPDSLLMSQDCTNKCNQVLIGQIYEGEKNVLSITSQYIIGTKYMFAINIEFGRSYMAKFKIRVSVAQNMLKYFGGNGVQPLEITVEPSYLMAISTKTSDDVLN